MKRLFLWWFLCIHFPQRALAEDAGAGPSKAQAQPDPYDLRKRLAIGGGITLGVGLVQVALGIFGAVKARERYDAVEHLCGHADPPWSCSPYAVEEMNAARDDAMLPLFALGFGSVSSVIGSVLLAAAPSAPLKVTVEPQREGATLTIGVVLP